MNTNSISIAAAVAGFLDSVEMARSTNTARTYRNALHSFLFVLADHEMNPDDTAVSDMPDDSITWFTTSLKRYAPTTERLYLTAVTGFFEYLDAERLLDPNLSRIRRLIRQRSRKPGQRLPQFPREKIEDLIEYAINLAHVPVTEDIESLRNLRDRSFILTLADTGLRVHEACNLQRGDLDWNEGKALIIGKGDRQALVRFSGRSMAALRDYLAARAALDGASGKSLASLPLFARHDRGAGKKIKPMTTTTGRNIVAQRVKEALGDKFLEKITPHSFRHYFVTTVLRASGGNLKVAQELARHKNIAVTQRYAHLSDDDLDQAYFQMFDEK
jgi:site-specific recombinase XerD